MKHPAHPGVCFVTGRASGLGRPLIEVARSAIEGGCDLVQVREKELTGGPLLQMAREVVELAKPRSPRCAVLVNDRLDVALAARAAGVHLPADGLPIEQVRRHAGRRFLIGRSVHSLAEARRAQKEGADYIFFGPVFATPSKASFGRPQGPEALKKVVESVRIPVWAIGGVDPATAAELRGIRIAGVAVISFILSAADPSEAVRALRGILSV
ncbi:MAG: thiamine-phosphate diphosphorylase [Acidobacteria bacterium 13_1_40CM_4_69_4]|nr:MAG: thiamine-phosphate diphosphorylase [Acidobacteria bacterium 13_1_40CM_4_69_4]